MDNELFKLLLNNEFYEINKANVSSDIFTSDIKTLYEILVEAHLKYKKDISTEELFALWKNKYPVATRSEQNVMAEIVADIKHSADTNPDIAKDILSGLWKRKLGKKIAHLGLELSEGKEQAIDILNELIESAKNGFVNNTINEAVTKDIHELLEVADDKNRWKFPISSLYNQVYGLGPGEFLIGTARPETGKTAFGVSLACHPQGWCAQGARVALLGNEEDARRTMLRAYSCYTGMTKVDIALDPEAAVTKFKEISDNLEMIYIQDWFLEDVENYVSQGKFDCVIIDQADKIQIKGDAEGHERLRDLYKGLRAMSTRQSIALVGLSQASVEAEGKTVVTPSMMEGSKTGKYAEGDIIIGIGKYPDKADGTYDPIRFLTIGKNKISGYHGTLACMLKNELSRYED